MLSSYRKANQLDPSIRYAKLILLAAVLASLDQLLHRDNSASTSASNTDSDMSYADAAAKGPKQSDSEKVPYVHPTRTFLSRVTSILTRDGYSDAVPEIEHSDSGVHSIDSLSSDSNDMPSYADQQLAKEKADAAKKDTAKAANQVTDDAKKFGDQAQKDADRLGKDAQKKFDEYDVNL